MAENEKTANAESFHPLPQRQREYQIEMICQEFRNDGHHMAEVIHDLRNRVAFLEAHQAHPIHLVSPLTPKEVGIQMEEWPLRHGKLMRVQDGQFVEISATTSVAVSGTIIPTED
jgi:hypothetical protein